MSKKMKTRTSPVLTDDNRVGNVCVSLAGHDAGLVLIVVGVKDENFVFVADGKTRKLSMPKMKKEKHISIISRLSPETCDKIASGAANDSLLRREIARVMREMLN